MSDLLHVPKCKQEFDEYQARQEFEDFCKEIDHTLKNGQSFALNFKDEGVIYLCFALGGFKLQCTLLGAASYKYDGKKITLESEACEIDLNLSGCQTMSDYFLNTNFN